MCLVCTQWQRSTEIPQKLTLQIVYKHKPLCLCLVFACRGREKKNSFNWIHSQQKSRWLVEPCMLWLSQLQFNDTMSSPHWVFVFLKLNACMQGILYRVFPDVVTCGGQTAHNGWSYCVMFNGPLDCHLVSHSILISWRRSLSSYFTSL